MYSYKLLNELDMKELRQELRERGLQLNGNKETLTARLRQALLEEDENPDTCQFEIKPNTMELLRTLQYKMNSVKESIKKIESEINTRFSSFNQLIKAMNENEQIATTPNKTEEQTNTIKDQTRIMMNELLNTQQYQIESTDERATPLMNSEQLSNQGCGNTDNYDRDAGDGCAVCDCDSKPNECGPQEMKRDDSCYYFNEKQNESAEETIEETYSLTEALAIDKLDMITSTSQTDQDNVGSASKPVAVGLKDFCLSASVYERNSKLDYCTHVFDKNCTYVALQEDCECQEIPQQGLDLTEACPAVKISARSPGESQGNTIESDAEVDGPLHVECYQPAPQASAPDSDEGDDVFDTLPSSGLAAHSQSTHRRIMLKQLVRSTVLMTTAMKCNAFLCAKSLPSALIDRKARQRQRHQRNRRNIKWRGRRKRHMQSATWMAPTRSRYKNTPSPTDRPPPALIKLHSPYC
ncbi:uncharacterized protein LOC106073053 [Biomphalaria glabrata]|uniref:Uncharacterized protein LOC106073053 n=1 Tax=Biomphalaria glabrata TaxID=6526 RepID=A0A9W2ZL92_BIOGL|nr:uncharacterized protein LOC106073053 [Biomphalaria glabrata]